MDRVRKQIGLKTSGGKGVVIAVLDTGVASHPDIRDRIVYFKDFVGSSKEMYDDNSHGTHICGIICGDGRLSEGKYRGIAPEADLVVCKVLDQKGEGSADTMLHALEFVRQYRRQLDIRILNISVGIGDLKKESTKARLHKMTEVLWNEGVLVVCSAGNKGPKEGSISSVSSSTKVLTVGCHDGEFFKSDKERCELHSGRGLLFSAYRKPDIVAPGTRIVSCNDTWNMYSGYEKASYIAKCGTSMATAIVSGCAALLLSQEPWLSPAQIKERLLYTATDLGEEWNKQGWGMVNVEKLLENT